MGRKIEVTKVVKQGFGRKINSEFGYSSFDIQPSSVEVVVDPPIDLTTDEGKEAYIRLQENLAKLQLAILEADTAQYAGRYEELEMTLKKKKMLLEKLKESEDND